MTNSVPQHIRKYAKKLAGPLVPFLVLPAYMLILVAGTLAQRYVGLYEVQNQFFSSIILWVGPVPLPGGLTLSLILTLALLAKFLLFSPWRMDRAGINLTHLGVLVLLIGGMVSAMASREGYMTIQEGEVSNVVSDYRQREFIVLRDGATVLTLRHEELHKGTKIEIDAGGPTVEILAACRYCRIDKRDQNGDENEEYRDMARFMAITEGRSAPREEENISGVVFRVKGVSPENDGIWLTFDPMPKPIKFRAGQKDIEIVYRPTQRVLPFNLELIDFTKQDHPGTRMAREYSSRLLVKEGDVKWPVLIEMNEPLRYKGYTFFQSSFAQDAEMGEATVLAVVENKGWPFPYVGSGLMAVGLLLQFFIALRKRGRI